MPASYVHQSVAAHAADALSLQDSAAERSALLAGAEGPDPMFFCFRPGKPFAPLVGSLLHTQKTDDFLLALCEACADDALLRAYCCGFFTHYATDTTFHPFVYAHSLTAEGRYSGNTHCTLEHQLETLHYRREGHATGLPVQMGGFAALDDAQRKKIAAALSVALSRVFPDSALSPRRLETCFSDAVEPLPPAPFGGRQAFPHVGQRALPLQAGRDAARAHDARRAADGRHCQRCACPVGLHLGAG